MKMKRFFILKRTNSYKFATRKLGIEELKLHLDGVHKGSYKKPGGTVTAGQRNISLLFYKQYVMGKIFNIQLLIRAYCSTWSTSVFLNPYQQPFKSYGLLSRVMHEEMKMVAAICNYKHVCKNPYVSSTKLKYRSV